MRVVEENFIWRYQPLLNNAVKQDEFREKYSFCWCGELSYSHDLCLQHFEELINCCRWDTPDREYQRANLSSIKEGLILRLVHNDISLTKERNKSFYEFYPSVAKKCFEYVSKRIFAPGQIQATKITEKLSVCSVMVLSDRFRFTPWFEHASQAFLNWCEQNGWKEPQLVATQWWAIAPDSFVPVPIPSEEIASIFDVDLAARERAQKAIAMLEASPEEYQEARNRWNQWLETEAETEAKRREICNKLNKLIKEERKKRRQQLRTAKQQSNKSQFLQGVEKLLKQGRR